MKQPILYRKRLIPYECILLKNDQVLARDPSTLVTSWNTLKPKKELHHGLSLYLLSEGFKISRFLRADGSLICWYCDIIDYQYDEATDTYVFLDLLADVLLYPDGLIKVVDLDEVVQALDEELLTPSQAKDCLRKLDALLRRIYDGSFGEYQRQLEAFEANTHLPMHDADCKTE